MPSAKKLGGLGTAIDVPLGHKDAAFVRSHFDAVEIRIPDAPRGDEIVVAVAVTDSGRPLARVGGLAEERDQGRGRVALGGRGRFPDRPRELRIPIGRIAEGLAQAGDQGPELGRGSAAFGMGHEDELILGRPADIDNRELTGSDRGRGGEAGQKGDSEIGDRGIAHHIAVVDAQGDPRPHGLRLPFGPAKRQSAMPRLV